MVVDENPAMRRERVRAAFFAVLAAGLLGCMILPGALLLFGRKFGCPEPELRIAIVLLMQIVLYGGILYTVWRAAPQGGLRAKLGLENFSWRYVGVGAIGAIGITVGAGLLTAVWQRLLTRLEIPFSLPPTLEVLANGAVWQIVVLLLLANLSAPLLEELIFRRICFDFFSLRCHVLLSAALTALLFAVCHFTLLQLPGLFAMAMLWQLANRHAGCLWPSVFLHFFNNFYATLLYFLLLSLGIDPAQMV